MAFIDVKKWITRPGGYAHTERMKLYEELYSLLSKWWSPDVEVSMRVLEATGLQPSEFLKLSELDRIPFLERTVNSLFSEARPVSEWCVILKPFNSNIEVDPDTFRNWRSEDKPGRFIQTIPGPRGHYRVRLEHLPESMHSQEARDQAIRGKPKPK